MEVLTQIGIFRNPFDDSVGLQDINKKLINITSSITLPLYLQKATYDLNWIVTDNSLIAGLQNYNA